MESRFGVAPTTCNEERTEGRSGGHEKTDFGGEVLPVYLPCTVDATVMSDARGANQSDCDHGGREAERATQGYLLSISDLELVDEADGNCENCVMSV